ncbi:MAG: discoidin domain-containing protein, partial [Bacteroidota bacterium]
QFGCDSVVITTTTLLPNDTTNVAATTCDPSQVGMFEVILTNRFGCDSVVITTTTLLTGEICGDCEPTLISQGKPTKTPCDYGFSSSDLGVDGNPGGNTPWTSNPDLVHVCQRFQNPWWEVDLEEQSEISEVCIYNRISTNQYLVNRLSNFYVLIACEPFDENASLDELLADENIYQQFIAGPAGYPTCIEVPQVVGQYVRIQMPGTETLHFGEVEVYGCPSDADCGPQPDPCAFLPKPMIEPAGPFLPSDGPQQLVANPTGGMWMGPVSATGIFDPSLGAGTYAVGYRLVDGDCEKMDMVEIVVQDPSFCNTPTNQAMGKPAMQSSTYGNGVASIAVDGDLDGSRGPWSNPSIMHTQRESSPWWKVDLEGPVEVKKVEIYNRTDCCGDRLRDFYVFVSNSPIDATRSIGALTADAAIEYAFHPGAAGTVERFDFDVTAQYVAIKLTGRGPLHLAEVKVLGCPAGLGCDIPTPGIAVTPPSDCSTADGSIFITGISGRMLEFSLDPNGPYQFPTSITFGGLAAGEYTLFVRDRDKPECVRQIPVQVIPDGGCGAVCTSPENLTQGATASQSSTYGNGSASFAIDGNLIGDSPWSANLQHTNTEASPWWRVELAEVSKIKEVKLYNRTNCCMDRLRDFYVFASESPVDGNLSIGQLTANPNIEYIYFPGVAGATENFDFGSIDAQYILVKLAGNGTLHMAEVEVLGCGTSTEGSRFGAANSALDEEEPIRMEAYPNPFEGNFTLEIEGALTKGSRLQLANALGQILEDREVAGNQSLTLGEGLAKGIYFVQVIDGDNIHQVKVVKLK